MVNHLRLKLPSSKHSRLLDPLTAHLLLLLLLFSYLTTVHAEANVTVDDGDSRIVYFPPGAWSRSVQMPLDYGGSHMLTQQPNATAVFNFTGVAIYFLSPLWPYRVNTAISLDSSPVSLIELVDRSQPDIGHGPETAPFRVVWSATGLANTQHTLQISVGAGQPFAIVDGLIYTDPSASASLSTPSPTGRIVASPSSYAEQSSSSASDSNRIVPIVVGTLFGILGCLILLFALWYFFRKRQRPVSEAWTVDGQTYAGAAIPNNGYPNGTDNGYGYAGTPTAYGYPPLQPIPPSWGAHQYAYAYGTPSAYPGVPPNRAPNRYQPGYTLSTITEKSTPQVGGTRTMPGTPLSAAAAALGANSPASIQSEMGYYTAPGSSVGQYSPAVGASQVYSPESQPQPPSQRSGKNSPVQRMEATPRK